MEELVWRLLKPFDVGLIEGLNLLGDVLGPIPEQAGSLRGILGKVHALEEVTVNSVGFLHG